jgi:membrane protease YdiL (CAAX protease family)
MSEHDSSENATLQRPKEVTEPAGTRARALLALLLLVPVPTLGVLCAMVWEPTRGTMLGQAIYGFAKVWILALPLVWRVWVERQPLSCSPLRLGGLGVGMALGLAIAGAIVAGYWLIGRHVIDPKVLRDAATANGLNQPLNYLWLALYFSLINSLLEEYVWRWFVYRQCERLLPWAGGAAAIALSSAMFTLHHVIALRAQMGWTPTLLASGGIFIGGCTWSWLYRRYRSIWPGYVSHVLADVAALAVGWMLLFGAT